MVFSFLWGFMLIPNFQILARKGKEKKKSHWLQAYNNIMAWPILIIEY